MAKIDRAAGWLARRARGGFPPDDDRSGAPRPPLSLHDAFSDAQLVGSDCLCIERCAPLVPPRPPGDATATALLAELRLIYGIGARYTEKLQQDGYTTLIDLCAHPRWGLASSALLADWGTPFDSEAVFRSLDRWLPSADPLCLRSLGLVPPEKLLFFDLETLGLSNAPVFLVAAGRFTEEGFVTRQYLAASLGAEVELLDRISCEIQDASALLSYNGKSFDWTVLRERSAYYGVLLPDVPIHVDLLHHARRALGAVVPDCHLSTIEERVLGIERMHDVPSEEVPIRYTAYLETGDAGHLLPIVQHNRQDLLSLVALLEHLSRMIDNA